MLEQGVQTHEPAVAPTPDSYPTRIHVRTLGQRPRSHGLVPRFQHPQLAVDRFPPFASERGRCPMVIDAGHEISALGEHEMPQVISSPEVLHRGGPRPAIYMEEEGILLRGI